MVTTIEISRKEIARVLHDVADPEIPGISIVDLGMVLDIREEDSFWKIIFAPTYSGCPAIDVIPILVNSRLEEEGYHDIKVEMEISPPWSTDWISEEGKEKLELLGYAPPHGRAGDESEPGNPKHCPQCGSEDTEIVSRFGSTPCKAAYRCNACLEPFEYFKCY